MDLSDLTPDEEVVLMGLLREVVQADGDFSEEERGAVGSVRLAMGEARFTDAMLRAQERYASRADLKDHAKAVERPAARKLIFEVLSRVAETDGLDEREERPLRWLASWWDLEG